MAEDIRDEPISLRQSSGDLLRGSHNDIHREGRTHPVANRCGLPHIALPSP